MFNQLEESKKYIQSLSSIKPTVGVTLGSGLGAFVDKIQDPVAIPYSDIPNFFDCNVEGHQGKLILGKIYKTQVAILQGRIHCYEGYSMDQLVFPTRLLKFLGIQSLILTNAAGGINSNFSPGDLVLIKDHINLMGKNPLVGPNIKEFGPRFPDMTEAYNVGLRECFLKAASEMNYELKTGVYAAMLGPTYETPAEVKMAKIIGADMVGMSTVPESIVANHMGLKVAGISCITNMAAGIEKGKLSHDDIKAQATKVMDNFSHLLFKTISFLE